jgi:hypothetical protein
MVFGEVSVPRDKISPSQIKTVRISTIPRGQHQDFSGAEGGGDAAEDGEGKGRKKQNQ